MEKVLYNVRLTLKNDTEENWEKAVNFVPKKGEPIIYNKDAKHNYSRIKIGDGITKVRNLPFSDIDNVAKLDADNTFSGSNEFTQNIILNNVTPVKPWHVTNKAYVDEKSKTAEKLATPRNIRIGGNAIGTAVPFDGSKDINVPISGLYNTALIFTYQRI